MLTEVIALNLLIYTLKPHKNIKVAENFYFLIFLSTVAWKKRRKEWEDWRMYDLIILDLQLFPSSPPPPHKWVMKGPRTIYPSFQYL